MCVLQVDRHDFLESIPHSHSPWAWHAAGDEVTIATHDKERGTRTKIMEPKTPYRAPVGAASSVTVGGDGVGADHPQLHEVLSRGWGSDEEGKAVMNLAELSTLVQSVFSVTVSDVLCRRGGRQ
jgi:hypothetical protein